MRLVFAAIAALIHIPLFLSIGLRGLAFPSSRLENPLAAEESA
ncbi:MAG TPA: hypothetical protein VK574_20890 [Terracidiphilus sp.]|jgi:hypothetical protein|nr:hypothetical protein [Terracidiphilus sp.]